MFKELKRGLLFLLLGTSLLTTESRADELGVDELSQMYGETTIITASKREQKIIESPSAIAVITAEDIKQSGATQLGEAIRGTVGTLLGYTGAAWMNAGGIRGFHHFPINKVMFLIDGVQWVWDLYSIPLSSDLPISLDEIERIEILRGPGSSLYGSDAMFGVINVITKKAKDTQYNQLSLTGGEKDTVVGNYSHGASINDKIFYRFSYGGMQRSNWDFLAFAEEPVQKHFRTNLTLDYAVDDNSNLNIFGGYVDARDFQPVFNISGHSNFSDSEMYLATTTYSVNNPNMSLRYWWTYKDNDKMGLSRNIRSINFYMGRQGVDFQHTLEPLENDILVWGINYYDFWTVGPLIGGRRSHDRRGIFLDNTYKMNDYFHINTALRYDHDPNIGDNISHRLTALYFTDENSALRFSWGSAFRNPDFAEQYASGFVGGVPIFSSQGLNPEKGENFEIGYQGVWFEKLKVESNVFYTKTQDFVGLVVSAGPRGDFLNLENITNQGAEFEVKYPFTKWLTGKFNYTYLETWEEDIANRLFAAGTPQHQTNAQLRAKFDNGISSQISGHYKGKTEWSGATHVDTDGTTISGGKAKDYFFVDLRLGYAFALLKNDAEIALSALNLFDNGFDDFPYSTSDIGRRVTGSFTYKF